MKINKPKISDIIFIGLLLVIVYQLNSMYFTYLKYQNNYVINIPLNVEKGFIFKKTTDNKNYNIVLYYDKKCYSIQNINPLIMCIKYEIFDKNNNKILSGFDKISIFNKEFLIKKKKVKQKNMLQLQQKKEIEK